MSNIPKGVIELLDKMFYRYLLIEDKDGISVCLPPNSRGDDSLAYFYYRSPRDLELLLRGFTNWDSVSAGYAYRVPPYLAGGDPADWGGYLGVRKK